MSLDSADLDALDYYALLGVARDATADAVKRAFHDFARRYHPDRYLADPEAHRRMLALYRRGTEAYRVLSDPGSRRLYGQCLEQGVTRYDPSIARQSQRPTSRPTGAAASVAVPRAARVPADARASDPREHPREATPAAGTVRPRSASTSSRPASAASASQRPASTSPRSASAAPASQGPPAASQRPSAAPRRTPVPSSAPPAGPSLADATSGRAREFALRAQRALDTRQYRSARLSLRLALSHDEGNVRLAEELARLDRKLGRG